MTLKDAITRWEKYLKRIQSLLDDISEEIQNNNFADSSDAVSLICLHTQLCSVRSNALLGINLTKTTLDELIKSNITYLEGKVIKHDESENS